MIPTQLTLGVNLDDSARFDNFLASPANEQMLRHLQCPEPDNRLTFLWGKVGSGRTHLLQAACHVEGHAGATLYLPLHERGQLTPSILDGTSALDLLCIDDIDAIAGETAWEEALFSAYNAIRDSATRLVMSSTRAPQHLRLGLPDLQSRLQSTLVLRVQELTEEEKLLALQLRARNRGIDLSDAVGDYILARSDRSLPGLLEVLNRIDASSLQHKRKLSIALVKATMGW